VREFARWFMARPIDFSHAPHDGISVYTTEGGVVSSLILYRDAPFQAELFFGVGPGYFPDHSHPHVDSIEVVISGGADFTLRGQHVIDPARLLLVSDTGALQVAGARVRIRPGVLHGANVGPKGAAFLSLQHWLEGVAPTSVGLDWEGPSHIEVR
jgi:hypothetical protein